jgi:hypothetical protein
MFKHFKHSANTGGLQTCKHPTRTQKNSQCYSIGSKAQHYTSKANPEKQASNTPTVHPNQLPANY